jgi:hypothetical protein
VDLKSIFLGLQRQMIATLQAEREVLRHSGTKGASSELRWLATLQSYLPKRYCVDRAFVLDSTGSLSEQIDIVIYDRQYSPFLFNQDDAKYVPAEAVYAVIEVKQELTSETVAYAGNKAASVRKLHRTSAPIPHAGGTFDPKAPPHILAGIVALESAWNPPFGNAFEAAIQKLSSMEQLDVGCALRAGGFRIQHAPSVVPHFEISSSDSALIFFFLKLMSSLQAMGTVAALDFDEYGKVLTDQNA